MKTVVIDLLSALVAGVLAVDIFFGPSPDGALSDLIAGWVSQGTFSFSGGRRSPGGGTGCTPSIFDSAEPNWPGCSE